MSKLSLILLGLLFSVAAIAQTETLNNSQIIEMSKVVPNANRYEVELLENPNPGKKDTREVNSVLIFERDSVKIVSRRSNQIFKEFKYSEIKMVEHSFSKNPLFRSNETRALIFAALFGSPFLLERKEKHWLTILGENGFAVLKIENDNYRLIKMEFTVKKFEVENVNEDRQ